MKHVCLILATFAACIALMHGATNDYIWSQKPASGPLVSRNLAPTVGRIIGFPTSINSPETIIIGSGLTLTGSTLTASGGAVSTLTDVTLTSIASGDFLKWNGTAWINRTAANVRTDLGLGTLATQSATITDYLTSATAAATYQPLDADLTTLASATAAGIALMDDADASAQRTTLGLGTLATQNGTIGNYAPLASPTFSGTVTMPSLGLVFPDGGGVIGMEFGGGLNKITLKTASLSGVKTVTIPATTGTIITTGDTGTVTNTMLAGSIDLTSKVTGTLPVANGGTGITSLGTGVATWLGTPTISNLNTAVSDADLAILGANTFEGVQTLAAGSVSAPSLTMTGMTSDTGMYSTGTADEIAFAVGGVQRLKITNNLTTVSSGDSGGGIFTLAGFYGSVPFAIGGTPNLYIHNMVIIDPSAGFTVYEYLNGANNLTFKSTATHQYIYTSSSRFCVGIPSATPAAHTLSGPEGVGTNITGGTLYIGTRGTGSGTSGAIIFQTHAAGASSSTPGTLSARLTINELGEIIPVLPTSAAGLTTGALWNDGGTVKVAP